MANQMTQSQEQPLYRVYGSTPRALIPKAGSLLLLSFLFYLGVLVNIALLELDADQETFLKTGTLALLGTLFILGMSLSLRNVRQPYLFYKKGIVHGKEIVYYQDIANTNSSRNFLDRVFKTYSIRIDKKMALRHIPESIQLSNYLQQLIEYTKRNQFKPSLINH